MTTRRYGLEIELRDPVVRWLASRWEDAVVADEVGPRYAPADIVAALPSGLEARLASGVAPVTGSTECALVDYLATPRTEDELRAWSACPWRSLRRDALEPLAHAGVLTFDEANQRWCGPRRVEAPFHSIVSVELKLRNVRRALAQASLHRVFVDAAYVAAPRHRVYEILDEAARMGIGVLAVENDKVDCLLDAETREPVDRTEWRVAGETVLAALTGVRHGSYLAGAPGGRPPVLA